MNPYCYTAGPLACFLLLLYTVLYAVGLCRVGVLCVCRMRMRMVRGVL